MPWLSLKLELDAAQADVLGDALLEAGAHSVSTERIGVEQGGEERWRLDALFARDADAGALLRQAAASAGLDRAPEFTTALVDDEDWVRKSQAQFAPIGIAERLWIVPSWHAVPAAAAGAAIVRLDPGLAFGTGTHPSTRLALQFLAGAVKGGERVLDYGCGSGILAIAAAKLGAGEVHAVDIDPEAVKATRENAGINGVELRIGLPDALASGVYDLVVANILAQPLIVLAPLLAARMAAGSRLALSGILETQAGEVAAAYAPHCEAGVSLRMEGWALVEGRGR